MSFYVYVAYTHHTMDMFFIWIFSFLLHKKRSKICENLHHGDMIAIKIFTRTQMKRGWLHSTKMNIYTKQKYAKKQNCCVVCIFWKWHAWLHLVEDRWTKHMHQICVCMRWKNKNKYAKYIIKMVDWWLKRPWVSRCMIYLCFCNICFFFVIFFMKVCDSYTMFMIKTWPNSAHCMK